jgi:hypothetical protein
VIDKVCLSFWFFLTIFWVLRHQRSPAYVSRALVLLVGFEQRVITLRHPLHQSATFSSAKKPSRIVFSEVQSLFFPLLSFFVLQYFFLLTFDTLLSEKSTLCCSYFVTFFLILSFSVVENLESIHCFLLSYLTE